MDPSPDLAALIDAIAEDPDLLRVLSAEATSEDFAACCVAAAEARELRVTAPEIRALLRFRGIRWLERNAR